MLDIVLVFVIILGLVYYIKSSQHPERFPPGPRAPLPVLGDAYLLGQDFIHAFKGLRKKYGDVFGMWLGPRRGVVVCDFDNMQELLSKPESANRQYVEVVRKSQYQ